MKFSNTFLIAVTTLAAYVNANMLQINNPTVAELATAPRWVQPPRTWTVILNTGPSEAVRYVATLSTLDCSGSNTRTERTVPLTVSSGTYSIVVRSDPELSYTNTFTINNPS
ncbi:hypothetical protein BGZ97_005088 [Linnemannia gamsii]|uniref:Uncharacterized protein n=1 Tax=Linnemannia gamsii TaxID=64522 RepID=A0A9P6UGE3_9FUNG|nr:hypothetical protein BGZ97_005088 [Linnemannia gamsii]